MSLQEDFLLEAPLRRVAPRRVLLVEDSRMFSAVLAERFENELGLEVVHCASFKALTDILEQESATFTMAVVNLNLPDAASGEALEATFSHNVPTIVFTASYDVHIRNRIVERNVVDYVLKDTKFALDNLISAVRRAIANRSTRILVVDDLESARRTVAGLLEAQQFMVHEAGTGLEALEALDLYDDIELVITDYHMPDMDGYELTRRIRHLYGSDRLRVIGVSSSSDRLLSVAFLKAGACDFIYRPFVPEELQCRVAQNIETLTQLKQLRAAASSDYLTGLYNRRYFYNQGPRIVNECLRGARPVSVAMLDIDHFKRLNDTYGHETGDKVLKAVARHLDAHFEGSDKLLSRLGGEEFAILFPDMDSRAATEFCDGVRDSLSRLKVSAAGDEISVTVSMGVADIGGHEAFENYLHAADQFLYMAKHRGRNLVYSDALLLEEGTH